MSMDPNITAEEVQNRIRELAFHLWEQEGRPDGAHEQHWLRAQKEVLEEVDRSGATGPVITDAAAHEPRRGTNAGERQDDLLDEAIEETFPASDPISPKRIT